MKNNFLHYTKWIMSLLVMLPSWAAAEPAKLTDVYISNAGTSARIEFSLSRDVSYRAFLLNHPARLVIDMPNTQLATSLKKINFENSVLIAVRSSRSDASTLRLVWSLKKPVKFKAFSQAKKIMFDMYVINGQTTIASRVALTTKNMSRAPVIVVIDPGHGGRDPGAVGKSGTKEKNVVIAISRRLAELINQQSGMHAVLTRKGDYFVPLRERLKLARKGKADLFVSIHADSFF